MMRRIRPGYPAVMAAYISKLQILLAEPLATWLRPTLGQRAMDDLVWINLFWGLINLMPIWPLDGVNDPFSSLPPA